MHTVWWREIDKNVIIYVWLRFEEFADYLEFPNHD
jgi:hypothetical protein